jgi:hypothetical protein
MIKETVFADYFCPHCGEKQVRNQQTKISILLLDNDLEVIPDYSLLADEMWCCDCKKNFAVNFKEQ